MAINKDAFVNYTEPTIMGGTYPATIARIENKANKLGVDMGVVTIKLLDEAPYGKELDEDNFLNGLNQHIRMYVPTPDDSANLPEAKTKIYAGMLANFVDACGFDRDEIFDDSGNVDWGLFLNAEVNARINIELIDKDNPEKGSRPSVAFKGLSAIG